MNIYVKVKQMNLNAYLLHLIQNSRDKTIPIANWIFTNFITSFLQSGMCQTFNIRISQFFFLRLKDVVNPKLDRCKALEKGLQQMSEFR